MIEAIYDLVEEAADKKLLCDRGGNAAGEEVKHFVLADLAGGRAVTAFDVVGQDFQTGHRVGFGVVAQKEVADLLVGVGKMGVRLDSDQAAEGGASAIV